MGSFWRAVRIAAVVAGLVACSLDDAGLASVVDRTDGGLNGAPVPAASEPDGRAPDTADAGDGEDGSNSELPCDEDGDGEKRPLCGGRDCCDTDKNAFPGQTLFFAVANACGTFDYDCDAKVSFELEKADCRVVGLACVGDGFTASPACGAVGAFTRCTYANFACGGTDTKPRAQRCR